MRTLLGGGWRFSKLGRIHENTLRLRVVCHGLRAQFRFHFASFAVVILRVLMEDVDPASRVDTKTKPLVGSYTSAAAPLRLAP
jgi:hypothetical protein